MDYCQLGDLLSFTAGVNPTRIEKQNQESLQFYDHASFESDLNQKSFALGTDELNETSLSLVAGDLVISSPSRLAAIVGADNEGKLLTLNFIKVNIKGRLDKFYFLYLFNQSRDVQRQKERELQGTGTSMRIPVKSLERIRIPLPPIEEQKKIGQAYEQLLLLQTQLRKYSQLLEATVQTSLEQILRSQSHE